MSFSNLLPNSNMDTPLEAFQKAKSVVDLARADFEYCYRIDGEAILLSNLVTEACLILLNTPAPDTAALHYKLELFRDEILHCVSDAVRDAVLEKIIADASRLAGLA